LTLWNPDHVLTLMTEPVLRGGFAQRGGFTHSSASVRWTNSVLGDVDLVLVGMTAEVAYAVLAAASESLISRDQRQVGGGGRRP
jgi:hypothetical protein